MLSGRIKQNTVIDGTLNVTQSSTLQNVTATNLTATAVNFQTGIGGAQNVGTLNVTNTTNTRDPSTNILTQACATFSGGVIIQMDTLISGNTNVNGLSANTINVAALTGTGNVNFAQLSVSGSSSFGPIGLSGKLVSTNTSDYTSSTNNGSFVFPGGGSVNGTLALGSSASPFLLSTNTLASSSTQSGTNIASNIFRLNNTDTTNTATRLSVANNALGNTYYDSSIALWTLGSSSTSTNYERLMLGVNSSGGYLNYLYGGSGSSKTLTILQGATFSSTGSLQLTQSLSINGVTRIATPSAPYTLTEPSSLPSSNGMMLTSTTNGVQSWSMAGYSVYTGDGSSTAPTLKALTTSPRLYIFTQTLQNSNGQLVFYLTNTGTSSGTVLGNFESITFAARSPSSSAATTGGPWASESYRGTNGVVCNVLTNRSTTVVLGGTVNGVQAAPSGTIVTCTVLIT